jgi:acyl transferase domain-containing protein
MMLHHKEIIPNIRFTKANPKIDFLALKMQVQTEVCVGFVLVEVWSAHKMLAPISWRVSRAEMAASDGAWVTSISSYGVGGSNAHIVLESVENRR